MYPIQPQQQNKYAMGRLQPRQNQLMPGQVSQGQTSQPQVQQQRQIPPQAAEQMQAQAQMQATQAQQGGAFPQAGAVQAQLAQPSSIPVDNPQMGVNPHQQFIQEALKQGYPPDMVMQFLKGKLNLQ